MKKYAEHKVIFLNLLNEGKSQKEAAGIIGLSEKTVSRWMQSLPAAIYKKQRKEIQRKIDTALKNKNTDPSDIAKLADAAVKLEKCISYSINNPL